jgi:acetoin utilization deacetylase AcuC-like enzyme
VIVPFKADEKHLKMFHSNEYVDFLKKCSEEEDISFENLEDDFGIGYDCPHIEGMFEFSSIVAGASITAAHLINTQKYKYAINW